MCNHVEREGKRERGSLSIRRKKSPYIWVKKTTRLGYTIKRNRDVPFSIDLIGHRCVVIFHGLRRPSRRIFLTTRDQTKLHEPRDLYMGVKVKVSCITYIQGYRSWGDRE